VSSEAHVVLEQALDWHLAGHAVALATVIETWGSSPRPVGSQLAITDDGRISGSVSGGCIESAVVAAAREVLTDGGGRQLTFGVSDAEAWEVGLSCGGTIRLYLAGLNAALLEQLLEASRARRPIALVTRLDDGAQALVEAGMVSGELQPDTQHGSEITARMTSGRSGMLADSDLFIRTFVPSPRLVIIGAVHIAQHLAPMATAAGFAVTLIDPRTAFATTGRFPGITLVHDWPETALTDYALDAHSALVTLSHDPKLDDPALVAALRSPAFYVGALGSRRTHASRKTRLSATGLGDQLERIHAPIGLDLGGRGTAEIAVAILAEIIQMRHREAA